MNALTAIVDWCRDAGVEWERTSDRDIVVVLPGEQKLRTTVSLTVSADTVTVNAFVIRHPDENADAVHRWLLERNRRMFALGYAIDQYGDVFLVGSLPAGGFDMDVMDRLMGSVLLNADQVFNTLLELGFSSAIRAEWAWRLKAGESTANLAAFGHLAPDEATKPAAE
ncbi:MAG: hypothetical protein QG597_3779 [Actinomycetota bacterium]|nr:hypothetical protein [Actinomycetota bacterium]